MNKQTNKQVNALSKYGQTALDFATTNNRIEVVQELLEAGADPLLEDRWGVSALEKAQDMGHHGVVEQIKNFDPDASE